MNIVNAVREIRKSGMGPTSKLKDWLALTKCYWLTTAARPHKSTLVPPTSKVTSNGAVPSVVLGAMVTCGAAPLLSPSQAVSSKGEAMAIRNPIRLVEKRLVTHSIFRCPYVSGAVDDY